MLGGRETNAWMPWPGKQFPDEAGPAAAGISAAFEVIKDPVAAGLRRFVRTDTPEIDLCHQSGSSIPGVDNHLKYTFLSFPPSRASIPAGFFFSGV
jgi:hypothetical protein